MTFPSRYLAVDGRTHEELMRDTERAYFKRLMFFYAGNITQVAAHAHRNRTEMYRILQRLGINRHDFSPLRGIDQRGAGWKQKITNDARGA